MNINSLTIKAQELLQAAMGTAQRSGQQALEPLHILSAAIAGDDSLSTYLLGEDFYERLIEKVQDCGATFVMDVDGQKLLDSLPAHPLLIKPNREELEAIFGTSFENNEQIIPYGKKLLDMGAQNVIVSMAGDGALLFTNEKVYFAQGIKGELKNSIGAGDSTVAGFLAEYSQSKDPLLAFRQAIACGTSKAFSDDMPSRAFLEDIYKKVNISEVK